MTRENPIELMQAALEDVGFNIRKVPGGAIGGSGVYCSYGGVNPDETPASSLVSCSFYFSIRGLNNPEASFCEWLRPAWDQARLGDIAEPRGLERLVPEGEADNNYLTAVLVYEMINS